MEKIRRGQRYEEGELLKWPGSNESRCAIERIIIIIIIIRRRRRRRSTSSRRRRRRRRKKFKWVN